MPARASRVTSRSIPSVLIAVAMTTNASCDRGGPTAEGPLLLDDVPPLSMVEELRIGGADDPDAGFTSVSIVRIGPDGMIYVVEAVDAQIRVYDEGGSLVRRIGRRGSGPEEFAGIAQIGFVGDTMWVSDLGNARVALYTRDGEPMRTVPAPMMRVNEVATVVPSRLRPDGRFETTLVTYQAGGGAGGCPTWTTLPVPKLLVNDRGEVVDTLGWSALTSFDCQVVAGRGIPRYLLNRGVTRLPIGRDTLVVEPADEWLSDDQAAIRLTRVAVRESGGRDRPRLTSDTLFNRMYLFRPEPIQPTYVDSIIRSRTRLQAMTTGVTEEDAERVMREYMQVPRHHYPVTQALEVEGGGLWLRREDDGSPVVRWTILDADGHPVGELTLPRSTAVHVVRGSTFWVVERDASGVAFVVRYRISGG